MRPLHRKLQRDIWSIFGQVVSIALVISCGVAIFVTERLVLASLQWAQADYYAHAHFGEVFAHLERAPKSVADAIARLPGIDLVEPRLVFDVTLNVRGLAEPAVGRFVSLPERAARLNQLHLREGRFVDPRREGEVMVSEAFALKHRVRPGAQVQAVINGRLRQLTVVGIALSPEFIFQIRETETFPDEIRYGVFWIAENQLAASFDMEGSFNDLVVTLARGAREEDVISRVDRALRPYGGLGAHGRHDQKSHRFLSEEIRQLRTMALFAPSIFLMVSAILLNLILSRLIALQREQIAALRAFGYTQNEIAVHYLELVALIVTLGVIPGTLLGVRLGRGLLGLYAKLYHFPHLVLRIEPVIALQAFTISIVSGALGAIGVILRASRMPPAVAMRPEAPESYHPTWAERLGLQKLLSMAARMVLRNIERRPLRALLTFFGIAMSVAILILGGFIDDSINHVMDAEFHLTRREDVTVTFLKPRGSEVLGPLKQLPGVMRVEPFRAVAVRFRAGHRVRLGTVLGILPSTTLFRPASHIGITRNYIPASGLVLSSKLAELLAVKPGESILIEVLAGHRGTYEVPIVGTIDDTSGLQSYMALPALQELIQEGRTVTGAYLQVDPGLSTKLYRQLKETPAVSAVTVKVAALEGFRATIAENLLILRTINVLFATVMAMGVAYSVSRISLSERSRELATLRVLGFTRAEISFVLLGELTVIILTSLPLGLFLGWLSAKLVIMNLDTEIFRIPLVIHAKTYGAAVGVVLTASIIAGLLVRRRLDELDLIAVLKERD